MGHHLVKSKLLRDLRAWIDNKSIRCPMWNTISIIDRFQRSHNRKIREPHHRTTLYFRARVIQTWETNRWAWKFLWLKIGKDRVWIINKKMMWFFKGLKLKIKSQSEVLFSRKTGLNRIYIICLDTKITSKYNNKNKARQILKTVIENKSNQRFSNSNWSA